MKILESGTPLLLETKTCGHSKKKNIFYHFIESSYNLCLDKNEIVPAQVQVCNRLLKHTGDESVKKLINQELAELNLTLDMRH